MAASRLHRLPSSPSRPDESREPRPFPREERVWLKLLKLLSRKEWAYELDCDETVISRMSNGKQGFSLAYLATVFAVLARKGQIEIVAEIIASLDNNEVVEPKAPPCPLAALVRGSELWGEATAVLVDARDGINTPAEWHRYVACIDDMEAHLRDMKAILRSADQQQVAGK